MSTITSLFRFWTFYLRLLAAFALSMAFTFLLPLCFDLLPACTVVVFYRVYDNEIDDYANNDYEGENEGMWTSVVLPSAAPYYACLGWDYEL